MRGWPTGSLDHPAVRRPNRSTFVRLGDEMPAGAARGKPWGSARLAGRELHEEHADEADGDDRHDPEDAPVLVAADGDERRPGDGGEEACHATGGGVEAEDLALSADGRHA